MNEGIQGAIVGLMVIAAGLYLLRKYLPRRKPGKAVAACGSCSSCKGGSCH
jgi:hypothetical protein